MSFELKAWLYLPFNPAAWLAVCVALVVLSVLGMSPLRPANLPTQLTESGLMVATTCSVLLNVVLMWRQARPRYLTTRTAAHAFISSFLLLTASLTLSALFGTQLAFSEGWWQGSATPLSFRSAFETGELTLTAVLAFTALWPAPDSLDRVIELRKRSIALIRGAQNDVADRTALIDALTELARPPAVSWRTKSDETLYREWRAAADTLAHQIQSLSTTDLRAQGSPHLQQALNVLQRDQPATTN